MNEANIKRMRTHLYEAIDNEMDIEIILKISAKLDELLYEEIERQNLFSSSNETDADSA